MFAATGNIAEIKASITTDKAYTGSAIIVPQTIHYVSVCIIGKISNSFGTGNDLNRHYALYPYSSDITITEKGVITATLPAGQSYAENSFGLGANTMVAVTENTWRTLFVEK